MGEHQTDSKLSNFNFLYNVALLLSRLTLVVLALLALGGKM